MSAVRVRLPRVSVNDWRLAWALYAPMGLTQNALAEAMGVQRKHVNELCNDRRKVTAPTALILARVFGNNRTSG